MKHPAVLATLAFVVGFYLNVPVVVAGAAGLPTGSASAFALLLVPSTPIRARAATARWTYWRNGFFMVIFPFAEN